MKSKIVISINSSWNVVNFRSSLIRRLQQEGFDVVVIAPSDVASAQLVAMGVQHIPIAIDNAGSSPVRDARLALQYWRILKRLRPKAFLGWTVKPNIYGSLAARALSIPVINNVSGLGTAFIRRTLLTAIVSSLYRMAFRRSSTVFFQNDEDRRQFVDAGLVAAAQARLLPGSGINLQRFTPRAGSVDAHAPFTFLLVARLLRDKGIVEYVEAARALRTIGRNVRFQLLGFLDVVNRSAITREEVRQWQAEGVIDYLGHTDDVRPFLEASNCVVLPSYREGMPRALLEGAALGKPLIATDVPGCRDIARPGRNALLCAPADAKSLASAMEAMLALSPERRVAMGAESRAIAIAEFDEQVVIDRYMEALDRATKPGAIVST